jgi:CheY-like chemotaxis protein
MEPWRTRPRRPLRVMVVDDDREHREALSLILEARGDQVQSYDGASQAIVALREGPAPDIILLDLMMPHMDGWEFRLLLKKEPLWASIPIVAMSGVNSPQAAAMDVYAFLEKPISEHKLLQTVDESVEAHARQQELARAGELDRLVSLGALLGGISHEINNPLSIVLGSVEVAHDQLRKLSTTANLSEAPLIAQSLRALDHALEGAERVAAVVRSASLFAAADLEHIEDIDVHEVLESGLQIASNEIRHSALLVRDFRDIPHVRGNRARLGQVFLNLLLNAVGAIRESGERDHVVSVGTEHAGDYVVVTVSDTAAVLQPLPDPAQLDPLSSLNDTGTRLRFGLAVSREVVQDLGGRIEGTSLSPHGAAYRVWLPVWGKAADAQTTPASISNSAEHGRAVAVIDDEPIICELISAMLSGRYEVTTFTSPRAGLSALLQQDFDAILCDVMMPDLNGSELFEQAVRARPALQERFIFITGGAFTEHAQAFLRQARRPVLNKPCSYAELLRVVAGVTGRQSVQSES